MIKIVLEESLERLGVSMRQLALRAGLRPNTVTELTGNRAKQANFETLDKILNAMNEIAEERKLRVSFSILDIISYEYIRKEE
ncbi:helix-turn-helix domain-containing protein [Saccharibacillus deserti]|uniref:helix-turn-helix domain-containing protein n=1 Tax=Saccharibacillus deserti TaxID=1634444 RepID=UPI0015555767|nr:helix-turn-helix domain-containing protein [Saccharibacillus deserti]